MGGMIDVGSKKETKRVAKAQVVVKLKEEIVKLIETGRVAKGDVLEQAKVAGIMAAKKTAELIPLCHPLRLEHVEISFTMEKDRVKITTTVSAREKTGVEMEALTACAVAALTVYDMCKMYDKAIEITDLCLAEKRGGKGGVYRNSKYKSQNDCPDITLV